MYTKRNHFAAKSITDAQSTTNIQVLPMNFHSSVKWACLHQKSPVQLKFKTNKLRLIDLMSIKTASNF